MCLFWKTSRINGLLNDIIFGVDAIADCEVGFFYASRNDLR